MAVLTFPNGQEVKVEFDETAHSYVIAHKLADGGFSDFRPTHGITAPLAVVPKSFLKLWVAKLCVNETIEYLAQHKEVTVNLEQFLQDKQDYDEVTLDENGKKVMTYYRFTKLYPWYKDLKKAPDRAATKGKELGTWLHTSIEEYYKSDRKVLPVITDDVAGMWSSFMEFDKFYQPKHDGLEFLVYSLNFGYSGQGDFRGYMNNKYCIGDWKSTNRSEWNKDGIDVDYFFQLGGLAQAEFERTGKWVDDVFIANFDKKGDEPRVIWASDFGVSPIDCARAYVTCFSAHHTIKDFEYKFLKR